MATNDGPRIIHPGAPDPSRMSKDERLSTLALAVQALHKRLDTLQRGLEEVSELYHLVGHLLDRFGVEVPKHGMPRGFTHEDVSALLSVERTKTQRGIRRGRADRSPVRSAALEIVRGLRAPGSEPNARKIKFPSAPAHAPDPATVPYTGSPGVTIGDPLCEEHAHATEDASRACAKVSAKRAASSLADLYDRCEGCDALAGREQGGVCNVEEGTHTCLECFLEALEAGHVTGLDGVVVKADDPGVQEQVAGMRARAKAWNEREAE